ncbi:hypothetical protein D3C87_1197920 [compost metagenome]
MRVVGVAGAAIGVTDVTYACTYAEAVKETGMPGVVRPQRRLVAWHQFHPVPLVGALEDFGVGVGVGTHQFQVVGDVRCGFEFDAAYFQFTNLAGDVVLRNRNVLLAQIKCRSGQQSTAARWHVLHAHFGLLAFSRFERAGSVDISTHRWLERFGVGDVWSDPRIEHVAQAGVAAESLVALGVGGIVLIIELRCGVDPVFTTTQGQAPFIQRDLILSVKAGLVSLLVVVIEGGVGNVGEIHAANRVDHVARRRTAFQPFVVGVGALVIQAQ